MWVLIRLWWLLHRVSDDDDMSDDEEDFQDNGSHDSFIDDRTCLTNTATQSATSNTDMMAIYRSLIISLLFVMTKPIIEGKLFLFIIPRQWSL